MLAIIHAGRVVGNTGIVPAFHREAAENAAKAEARESLALSAGDIAVHQAELRAKANGAELGQEERDRIGSEAYQRQLAAVPADCGPQDVASVAQAWWLAYGNQGRYDPAELEYRWLEDDSHEAAELYRTGRATVAADGALAFEEPPVIVDIAALRQHLGRLVTERLAAVELDEDPAAIEAQIASLKAQIKAAG